MTFLHLRSAMRLLRIPLTADEWKAYVHWRTQCRLDGIKKKHRRWMQGRLSATGVTIEVTITMSEYEVVTGNKVPKEVRAQVDFVSLTALLRVDSL